MKPTPEQIKQMAIECGGFRIFQDHIQAPFSNEDITKQLQEFATRLYELGWKNRGESDVKICEEAVIRLIGNRDANGTARNLAGAIRKNTGE